MSTGQEYTLDDVIENVSDLHELLNTIRGVLLEMDFGSEEKRSSELYRIYSLTNVAGQFAKHIVDTTTANYGRLLGEGRATQ